MKIRDDDDAVVAGTPVVRQRERTYGPTLAWFLIILGYSLAQESPFAQVCPVLEGGSQTQKPPASYFGSGGIHGFQRCGPHDGNRRRSCCARCFERCTLRRLNTHWLGARSRSRPSWASRASATGWRVSDDAASGCCAGDLRSRANRAVNAGCGRYRRFRGVCRACLGSCTSPGNLQALL